MIWLTGDTHFYHENILRFCSRPFDTIGEHDEALINNWNSVVSKDDSVYHLGDLTLGGHAQAVNVLCRLNGDVRILAYPFHHDRRWLGPILKGKVTHTATGVVVLEQQIVRLSLGETNVYLCHFPLGEWPQKHYGAVHAHAHSHGNYKGEGRIVDVGVDCHGYFPVSIERVVQIGEQKGY